MNSQDRQRLTQIADALTDFDSRVRRLPGLRPPGAKDSLARQMIDSIRRVRFVQVIADMSISSDRGNPDTPYFDPIRAAALSHRAGKTDEAFWLVFLATHFGKHRTAHWDTVRFIYAGSGPRARWTWKRTSADVAGFRDWLHSNRDSVPGGFGNHRKYESFDARSATGTGAAIQSYVEWVEPPRTHLTLLAQLQGDPPLAARELFDALYISMSAVSRFGRTARFDYCTMISKLGLADIEPGHPYMAGATGPRRGASLLFTGKPTSAVAARELGQWATELGNFVGVGMQVIEDSLCNWQKNPVQFQAFRG